MSMNTKISCITVCRNCRKDLKKTLNSLLEQTYKDFEVVVIDGASTDGTKEMLEQYQEVFEQKNVRLSFISEPDNGIYDAMNKGIKHAMGEWTIFLNAGDWLACADTFHQVFFRKRYQDVSAIYGNYTVVYGNKYKYVKCKQHREMKKDKPSCHQAFFNRTSLLQNRGFNTKYKIMADYEWYLHLYLQGKNMKYIDVDICFYEGYGVSSYNKKQCYNERMEISKEAGLRRDCFLIRVAKKTVWGIIGLCRKKFGILFW